MASLLLVPAEDWRALRILMRAKGFKDSKKVSYVDLQCQNLHKDTQNL